MTPVDIAFEFYKDTWPDVDFLNLLLSQSACESDVGNLLKLADAVLYNWTDRDKYLLEVRTHSGSRIRNEIIVGASRSKRIPNT